MFKKQRFVEKTLTRLLKNSVKRTSVQKLEITASDAPGNLVDDILPFTAIPAVRKFPYFGTNLDFVIARSGPNFLNYIDKRHLKLGSIFRERIGPIDAVFVSSPDLMRSVFLHEGKCPRHPLPEAWLVYNQEHGCKRGLFFMDGEEWYKNRKLMDPLMLRADRTETQNLIEAVGENLIQKWKNHKNQSTDITEIPHLERDLYRCTIEVIIALMLGSSYNQKNIKILEPFIKEFSNTVHKIFEQSTKMYLIPSHVAQKWKFDSWTEFESTVTKSLDLAKGIVDIYINELEAGDGILSKMLELKISRSDIERIFADVIIAAGDTTAFSLQWALYLLGKNGETQENVRQNILQDGGMNSPLVRGVVRETLRLYPVAPIIGRFIESEAILGGFRVPRDSLVLLSLFTSGRDEHSFPNPLNFSPGRWIKGMSEDSVLRSHASLPFAMGGRFCIGRKIANVQMNVLLTKILTNFNLTIFNQNEVKPIFRMVTVPGEKIRLGVKVIS